MLAQRLDDVGRHAFEKGWHTKVESPHLFIDTCVQIWPDAKFGELNQYGVTAYLQTTFRPHDGAENALDAIADWWRVAREYPEVRLALTAADIEAAHAGRQAAIILGSQGGDFLGQDLTRLEMFQRMGLRVMIPAYNARTPLADGCLEPTNAGLSRMGRAWVAECNRLGVLIDCTHVGERSTLDILELSAQPVAFTHSNPKALYDVPRNITDEQIRKCAAGGGVIGLSSWAPLLMRSDQATRPTLPQFIDAVRYVVDMVGIDHVGIGTDMSHGTYPDGDRVRGKRLAGRYGDLIENNPRSRLRAVEGFDDWGQILGVADRFGQAGFSNTDIAKLLGGNWAAAVPPGLGRLSVRRRHLLAGGSAAAAAAALPGRLALGQSVGGGRSRAGTLVVAQNFDPISLWPNSTTASDNINPGAVIVQPLFWVNPRSGKPEPLLAEGMALDGPTEIRIRLRPGIRFTNGEAMDADAVVHSIEVFRDPKQTPAYAIYATPIERAEKIDDLTVRLRTKYPSPAIGFVLTQIYVVPPRAWTQAGGAGGFGQKPVGTGQFRLVEWIKDDRLVMDRNPEYWGGQPAPSSRGIERVVWRPVPDDTARAAGLQAGEFDITSALSITDVANLEGDAEVKLAQVPSFRIYTVSLSSLAAHPSPLHDRRVRQALNYAVDKDSLIRNVLFGRARTLNGQLLRQEQPGFDPALRDYPYDPAHAKALLAEAGHPNGFEVEFKFPSGRYAGDREVSEAVAGMLAKVGVRTRMTALEPGEFLRQLRARELAPMAFVGLAPPEDPDFQVSQYRSTWRYSYVQNPQFDALIDAGAQETDPAKRVETYRTLARLMHEEAPAIFLYQGMDYYGTSRRVQGFLPTGDGRIHLYGVSL